MVAPVLKSFQAEVRPKATAAYQKSTPAPYLVPPAVARTSPAAPESFGEAALPPCQLCPLPYVSLPRVLAHRWAVS